MLNMSSNFSNMNKKHLMLAVITSLLIGHSPLVAQESSSTETPPAEKKEEGAEAKDAKPEEVVKTGVIASAGNYAHGDQTISSDSSGAAPGDVASVITASVNNVGRGECKVTINNTSEENGYSVSYRVTERNARGSKVGGKGFSASLSAKESKSNTFRCRDDSVLQVELRSARKR